jgi:hypothetical protein
MRVPSEHMLIPYLPATIIHVDSPAGVMYGLQVLLGLGAGANTQASFAVIQAVVAPADAPNGLSLMLLGLSRCSPIRSLANRLKPK